MRSFRSKVLSALAWTAPVLAAVLPSSSAPPSGRAAQADGKLLGIDLGEQYAQATFSVPCAGCLGPAHTGHDDESLILSFKTHAHDQPCGAANVSLNGAYLPQEWHGDFASGSGSYARVTDLQQEEWYNQHDLDLEWESTCLHGTEVTDIAAQVLTVNIKAIDGKPITQPSGFTISFNQLSPPQLLRLEAIPDRSAGNKENADSWRQPPSHLRLVFSEANDTEATQTIDPPRETSLEDDIRELSELLAQAEELRITIQEKKKHIETQLSKDAHNLAEDLRKCNGIKCFVKTIANKAHSAWKIVEIHFHHKPPPPMGHPDEVYAQAWRAGHPKQVPESTHHEDFDDSALPAYSSAVPYAPSATRSAVAISSEHYTEENELPPRPPPKSPYLLAAEIALGILCCGCLVTIIRHKCSSPRTRSERAARQEQRRNEREYRRAARKLAWRRWWCGNWRDQQRIEDYEEKRALIQGQEEVLENAMQAEIRQLRTAHDIVNDLVRAEEGRGSPCQRCHNYDHPEPPYSPISTASSYPPTSLPELPSRPLSRTDSLPSYRSGTPSEPPSYEDNVDMSDIVANGFRHYTPSTTSEASSGWTPDSSVIDVSPRPSAETLRYAETINTCISESEDEE